MRAPRGLGVGEFLQHQVGRAFAKQDAVAGFVEGAHGVLGVVVAPAS